MSLNEGACLLVPQDVEKIVRNRSFGRPWYCFALTDIRAPGSQGSQRYSGGVPEAH